MPVNTLCCDSTACACEPAVVLSDLRPLPPTPTCAHSHTCRCHDWRCGACLIDSASLTAAGYPNLAGLQGRVVVTAAHCIQYDKASGWAMTDPVSGQIATGEPFGGGGAGGGGEPRWWWGGKGGGVQPRGRGVSHVCVCVGGGVSHRMGLGVIGRGFLSPRQVQVHRAPRQAQHACGTRAYQQPRLLPVYVCVSHPCCCCCHLPPPPGVLTGAVPQIPR